MDDRHKELVHRIVDLQAEVVELTATINNYLNAVQQHYDASYGHNHCFRNDEVLWEYFGIKPRRTEVPPREEFEEGCKHYADCLYSDPTRAEEFFEIGKK